MAKREKKKKPICSTVGGQAVMEGVMMMGKTSYCTAVRDPDGNIQVEKKRINRTTAGRRASKIPFVRGVVNMYGSLVRGTNALMRSAQVYGSDDEEPGRVEKWFAEKLKLNLMHVVTVIGVILGLALAIFCFMWLPRYLVDVLNKYLWKTLKGSVWEYVMLGVFKLVIFLAYLGLIMILKDIRKLYKYHGAEHKTINCYEKGLPLTTENVMSCSRIHDRCGTSFLFIVLIINIAVIGVISWALNINAISNGALRTLANIGIEIVLLPVITGISYEFLKLFAHIHGWFGCIFKWPGMLLQKVFTTREPEPEMVEVAIAAFNAAMEMDANPDMAESTFVTGGLLTDMLADTKKKFAKSGIDESDAEWIYSLVLGINRSELSAQRVIKPSETRRINAIIEKRLTGRPLWYIIGDVDFYDCNIKVDERALIPRPETEILAQQVVNTVEDGDKVLDMCTGSGCIAISVAKHCKDKKVQVTAVDVSDAAIMLAKENANYNSADVNFIQSDLFSRVHGRFNIIVCNPPYIKSSEIQSLQREVRDYEPRIALDGGEDGLDFYKRLAAEISRYIIRGGILMLEVGEGQAEEVLKLFDKREYAMVVKDFSGVDRFLKIAF
ncbi:MAG: peptide chain release factor N(5)-glutamine methyltransferase [Clostridia bacterium]|nr:peptide chain release factor N(5)-glutamine methyltransferase [Clostridia bacterium]